MIAHPFARLAVGVVVPALALRLLVPTRPDYLGHYVAGFGGTALLLASVLWRRRVAEWFVALIALVAIVGGVALEATVFGLAIFDPVDFAQQSLGAVAAAAAVCGARGSPRVAAAVSGASVILLWVGFRVAFS